jgi:hypothetical protein
MNQHARMVGNPGAVFVPGVQGGRRIATLAQRINRSRSSLNGFAPVHPFLPATVLLTTTAFRFDLLPELVVRQFRPLAQCDDLLRQGSRRVSANAPGAVGQSGLRHTALPEISPLAYAVRIARNEEASVTMEAT